MINRYLDGTRPTFYAAVAESFNETPGRLDDIKALDFLKAVARAEVLHERIADDSINRPRSRPDEIVRARHVVQPFTGLLRITSHSS